MSEAACRHPHTRHWAWYAYDGVLCIACCDCGAVLSGGYDLAAEGLQIPKDQEKRIKREQKERRKRAMDLATMTKRAETAEAQAAHYQKLLQTFASAGHLLIEGAASEMAQEALATAPDSRLYVLAHHPFLAEVAVELERAQQQHAPMHSTHEAYSVILEELEEFWLEVKKKTRERDPAKMRAELTQLAAMAARAVEELHL